MITIPFVLVTCYQFKKVDVLSVLVSEYICFFSGNLIPFGQVPVLQVDDAVIAQTYAILSYLADEFGMYFLHYKPLLIMCDAVV